MNQNHRAISSTGTMSKKAILTARLLLTLLAGLLASVAGVWATLALWYQLPGSKGVRWVGSVLWGIAVVALASVAFSRHSWLPLVAYVLAFAAVVAWWSTIRPSNHHVWSDDVAQLMSGKVDGNQVTLSNVRNFSWRSEVDYDRRWETRTYDLDRLVSADAVLSYWSSKSIAHAMISFGFSDGEYVVFSVEIRKKSGQKFSPIGGFFKQFEMILTAADERDIIRVRTNVRGEDDYLYPLQVSTAAMRELFLSYVQAANTLLDHPAFYNSVTSNCTTMVYGMAKKISPGLPHDARLLLTGYLPEYLYEIGALDQSVSLDELHRRGRVTERARAALPADNFSQVIRVEVNGDAAASLP